MKDRYEWETREASQGLYAPLSVSGIALGWPPRGARSMPCSILLFPCLFEKLQACSGQSVGLALPIPSCKGALDADVKSCLRILRAAQLRMSRSSCLNFAQWRLWQRAESIYYGASQDNCDGPCFSWRLRRPLGHGWMARSRAEEHTRRRAVSRVNQDKFLHSEADVLDGEGRGT